jgi:predicted dehydrogenase
MADRIRWGVAGCGGIARRRTIPEGIVRARNGGLAAVWDLDGTAAREVASQFGARAAADLADLLRDDVDAVYIASPPAAHAGQAAACARAGKPVLCEKPLGMTVAGVEAMIGGFRRADLRLGCAFMMRFHAQHQAALRLIREGRLGRPVLARAQLSCWYPPMAGAWRQDPATGGGGSLIDMGGHCIDLLEMFFGPVRQVSCITGRMVHAYASEDGAVATLAFENGAVGIVDTFFCIPDEASQNRLELYGSLGSILASGTIGQGERGAMTAVLQGDAGGYDAKQARTGGGSVAIDPEPVNMYRAEIEEFGAAILEGREPSHGADLGLRSQRVIQACYESARIGRTVVVGPDGPA